MNNFSELYNTYKWEDLAQKFIALDEQDVLNALNRIGSLGWNDFMALISPAAAPYLENMVQKSIVTTRQNFGNTIQLYIPLYLSNECQNICTYCGFSFTNKIPRITLKDEELIKEAEFIKAMGYQHVLLVTGEAQKTVGVDYILHAIELLKPFFSNISIEVQPLDADEYERLIHSGLHSVLVYQETYHKENYALYHPKGKKANFDYRLHTPDRLGSTGIHKIGLGVLLGLEDWRIDSAFCALHLDYLEKKYWRTKYSISFPRLRPASGVQEPKNPMNERELLQLICAYRLYKPQVELSLSTRESASFRNLVASLGITAMSAGSKTEPGGYVTNPDALEQFEIDDDRSPQEIADMLTQQNLQPVWKDWDAWIN